MSTSTKRPPDKNQVLGVVRRLEPSLRAQGVTAVYVFGSVARGEQKPGSDVDIALDVAPGFSLIEQAGVQAELSEALGCKVDVVLRKALRPEFLPDFQRDQARLF